MIVRRIGFIRQTAVGRDSVEPIQSAPDEARRSLAPPCETTSKLIRDEVWPRRLLTALVLTALSLTAPFTQAQNGIAAANIKVVQVDTNNTVDSVELTATTSINDLHIRGDSTRADFNLQAGIDFSDDVSTGVLISSVAQNGRDNGEPAHPGTNFCTSAIDYTRTGDNAGGYKVSIFSAPTGAEYNINVSAAFFPYAKWLGGLARNSGATNGGANDLFTGSPGLLLGTHFIELGGGEFTVDLTSFGIDSRTDGVLLVNHGKNEDNFALSFANPTNGTWSVFVKDNGSNGGSHEQDPVAFVYVPRTNDSVVSGKFRSDGTRLIYSGAAPHFDVTNLSTGIWRLTIPGQNPDSGVLIVSAEGGVSLNVDNIVSYEADGDGWLIQSRDLPNDPPPLQSPGATEPVASFLFIPSIAATPVSPEDEATGLGASPRLKVSVPNPVSGNLTVTFFGRPLPLAQNTNKDFTVSVLPDTQFYSGSLHGGLPAMFISQTDWLIANRTNLNLAFVSHLGDITQNGQNGGSTIEWRRATNAMYRLEDPILTMLTNGIPYGMGVGNHDQTPIGTGDAGDTTFFNQYFGISQFIGYDYYGGHYGANNNNSFQFFSAGGMDFICIHMEYDTTPSAAVLAWADNLLKTYPNHRAIVTSHWIVNTGFNATFSTQGQAIYQALKSNANLFLMVCGHIGGEGQRTDVFGGHTVYSILTDYQSRTNGGDGWMRYYTFSPSNNVIRAFTCSPWLNKYENDANSKFTLPYDMNIADTMNVPFQALATNVVSSSNLVSCVWPGRPSGVTHEWYAVVEDEAGNTATTATWRFNTLNVAPVAANQSRTVTGDAATNLVLSVTDANDDALTFQINTVPLHGLLQSFDASAGSATYVPVRGYRGPDSFTFSANDSLLSSSAASLNLTVVAPPDTDGNGLPDAWEAAYGITNANGDADGDGRSNLEEYLANTNPTNAASGMKITSEVRAANGHTTITWAGVGGVRYRVQYSNGNTNAGFNGVFTDIVRPLLIEMDASPVGTPSTQTFTDDYTLTGGPPAGGQRYYRIKVTQ